jgi:hypothetical protein
MLPSPPRSLLMVQAKAARGKELKELQKEMQKYRGRMFASLAGKYPE